ncbi:MAG TPA: proprotein convertase P-domain-containing protein [Myxococcota bacterium]|nr:proprotein convertase P-domain-containing protein [Myxococcota bacterium]
MRIACLLVLIACKGGDKGADDTDTPVDTDADTAGPEPEEVWEEVDFEPLELALPPTVWRAQGARVFTDAASFEAFTTLPAPPELAAGTRQVLVRVGKPSAYPGSFAAFTKVEKSESGKLSTDMDWLVPGPDCVNFVVTVPPAAFALIEPVGERSRFAVGWEYSHDYPCSDGAAEGAACTVRDPCGPNLFCQGITRAAQGVCRASNLKAAYQLPATTLEDDGVTELPVVVSGLAERDTDVLLSVRIDHPRSTDLRLTVESPSGHELTVVEGVPLPRDGEVSSALAGFQGDEQVNGTWIVRLYDTVAGERGSLDEGSVLEIASR